jgi:DNA-binding protein H-NS
MPNVNLSRMTVEALMDLRKRVDETLHKRRAELEKQLERIAVFGGARVVRGRGSALKGKKVPPKYRGPSGETWAGSWSKASLACCCDQGWKEARRFPDRQVSTKGTEKAEIEAVTFAEITATQIL